MSRKGSFGGDRYAGAMAASFEPDDLDRIRDGLRLFNEERFFEAHEILEEVWHRERGESRTFLQGLIQICAAYHHYQNGNYAGAADLLRRGSDKMEGHPRVDVGFDAGPFLERVKRDRDRIRAMPTEPAPEAPIAFPKISNREA